MKNFMGGFVGNNSGNISDCYSLLQIEGRKNGVSGFCGFNTGTIRQSFHSGRIRHMAQGFGLGGEQENCFFFTGHSEAKRAGRLPDRTLWRQGIEVSDPKMMEKLGFTPEIWDYMGGKQVLAFREKNWYCRPDSFRTSDAHETSAGKEQEKISINNILDLMTFANGVNKGDPFFRNAEVILMKDLNIAGREWTPIGFDRAHSFQGTFNGNGYRIRNFRIRAKNLESRGFFGVLEGNVYNLTVDCELSGGGIVGALAGQLLGGTIDCCGAVADFRPKGEVDAAGGLVGLSTGDIKCSYAAGKFGFFPVLFPLLVVATVIIGASASASFLLLSNPPEQPVNRPVVEEEAQFPVPEEELQEEKKNGENKHSISFATNTEATVELAKGKVNLVYQSTNAHADQKVVVKLLLSTGVVIAETGAIQPGNQITEMELSERAKKELKQGKYSATILMVPYSVKDETKGFAETKVPVTLHVK